ncbi:MAG: YihY family inner membrane protein [Betaproteobacteria bacterium]
MKYLKQTWHYVAFVSKRFVEDRCLMIAGSLTYTSLLALVPLFTVTLVLTSHIPLIRDLIAQVKVFALKALVPDVGGRLVTMYVEQFTQNAARLTIIGLLIILGTSVALIFTIDNAFNVIWRTRRKRTWWKRLSAYLAVLALGPLLIGISLTITSYLLHLTRQFDKFLPFLDDLLLHLAPFVLTTLALAIAYRVMPARHVPVRHALIGAIFSGLLFEIVKQLFVVYIVRVPTYSLVYGAFASVPIFLVWMFCCWMVVLVGAEIAATLSYFRHAGLKVLQHDKAAQAQRNAVRILNALDRGASSQGLPALLAQAPLPIDVAEDLLYALADARLVSMDRRGRYQLAKARSEISEADIQHALLAAQ